MNDVLTKSDLIKAHAHFLALYISHRAEKANISFCKLLAEVVKLTLMSDENDTCHVTWLELYNELDEILQEKSDG